MKNLAILALLLLVAPAAAQPNRPPATGTGDCAPSMGLNFVC